MTVQGEPTTVRDAQADALFTTIYRKHWTRLVRHIYFRLDLRHAHLAEDLAQETFMGFWRSYVQTGRLTDPDHDAKVYALLKKMTQGPIGSLYELCSTQRDRSLDFTDPANTPILVTGHAYALGTPGLAGTVADLEDAMDHMTACSQVWRSLHKERHTLRGQLADDYLASRGGLTDAAKERIRERLAAADREEPTALDAFRDACARVGQLRAEIETQAGTNWQSVAGMAPAPEPTAFKAGAYRNDRSVTHCPEGHYLDKDNTNFGVDGSRRCRACATTQSKTKQQAAPQRQARSTVSDDVISQARTLLADPENASRSLPGLAAELGVSHQTLMRRIPDYKQLRANALAGAAR